MSNHYNKRKNSKPKPKPKPKPNDKSCDHDQVIKDLTNNVRDLQLKVLDLEKWFMVEMAKMQKRLQQVEECCSTYEEIFNVRDWVSDGREFMITIPADVHCIKRRNRRLPFEVEVYCLDADSVDRVGIETETNRKTGDVIITTFGEPFKGVVSISR